MVLFAFFNLYITENCGEIYLSDYKMQGKPIFFFYFFVFLKMKAYICAYENTTSVKGTVRLK